MEAAAYPLAICFRQVIIFIFPGNQFVYMKVVNICMMLCARLAQRQEEKSVGQQHQLDTFCRVISRIQRHQYVCLLKVYEQVLFANVLF